MTPAQILQQFENYIDDELDEDHAYQLMTQAKNKLEMRLKPIILHDVDTSQTANIGDGYLNMKTLATNVRMMLNLTVGRFNFKQIPFIRREQWRDSARRYYIDWKNRQFAFTGVMGLSGPINQFFLTKTADITVADEDSASIIVWPSEFHGLIPFEMAEIFQANIDPDEISFRMSPQQRLQKQEIEDAFVAWDTDIKLQSMDGRGGFQEDVEGDWPRDDSDHIPDLPYL